MGVMAKNGCNRKPCMLLPAGSAVQNLALGVMAGGMLALGAFVAPVVFFHIPREEAAPVMAMIFRHFDVVLLVCMVLALVGEACRFCSSQLNYRAPVAIIRLGLLALLTGGMLFSTLKLNADIQRMNQAGWHRDYTAQGRVFERTHKLSEGIYKLNLLAAVLLLLLAPFAPVGQLPKETMLSETASI